MAFLDAMHGEPVILTEGAVIERLRRTPGLPLDPHVLHAGFVYEERGRASLTAICRQYLDIGWEHDLPMIVGTPTWRANPDRVRAAGLAHRDVNGDAARFVRALCASYGAGADRVYVGGLVACRGDAYDPRAALTADEASVFHRAQTQALAAAGVDFLFAATLPAVSEAVGLARAMAACARPYVLSFVVRAAGTCLDDTPLVEAVRRIDRDVQPPPTAYFVNCVHPTTFTRAMQQALSAATGLNSRVIGLQGNTSTLSPEELDGRAKLDAASPESFAVAMLDARRRCGTRILGGCCGTDGRHIQRLAELLRT